MTDDAHPQSPLLRELRKAGFTAAALNFPLSPAAFHWVCRFNGVDPAYAPRAWRYAPNKAMQEDAELWGSKMLEEQKDRIRWSREKPSP